MKKNRKFILAITLASYCFFIFILNLIGIITDTPIEKSSTDNVRNNFFKIYANLNSAFSVILKIDANSGMDPMPNPPLPPEIVNGNVTEILD